jgi:hypothetical protein
VSIRAFFHPATLGIGAHSARVRVTRAVRGHRRYPGTAEAIVRAGLERCWSDSYLTASPGHYRQFWTRDTGFAAAALVRLGDPWPDRLASSLDWAMSIWRRRRAHVTTTINPLARWPVDIFDYGVDSLPWLLSSMRSLGPAGDELARIHETWIAAEVEHFVGRVVDPETGLVRSDRHFSAHRDTFRNSSTAYANTMVAMLARDVAETGWGPDLLSRHFGGDWGSLLRHHFWLGDRFRDRLGCDDTSGEANILPFFTGVIDDHDMQRAALSVLRADGFATPYPLRFSIVHEIERMVPINRLQSADYQTTTTWTSLGSMYLSLLAEVDPAAAARDLAAMQALIERDGVFWEVLNERGNAWRSGNRVSVSDVSMLWSAILLDMLQSLG